MTTPISERLRNSFAKMIGRSLTVADSAASPEPKPVDERRRAPRLSTAKMSGIQRILKFELVEHEGDNILEDLGTQGLRFCCLDRIPPQEWVGQTFEAIVHLGSEDLRMAIQVVHIHERSVGCRIERRPPDWQNNVAAFIDPIEIGQRLREIDSSYLKSDEDGLQPHWFRCSPSCDVYYWTFHTGDLKCIQVFIDQHLIEWTHDTGIRTGDVDSNATQGGGVGIEASESFGYHPICDTNVVRLAYRMLSGSKIDRSIRNLFFVEDEPN